MKRHLAFIASLLLATGLTTGSAWAHPVGKGMGPMGGHHMEERGLHRLDLSDAQKDKIFEIRHAQEPALREQRNQMIKAREQLQALTQAEKYNSREVQAQADASAKAMARVMVIEAETRHRIRAVLTPEQRKQLDAFAEERREKMQARMRDR